MPGFSELKKGLSSIEALERELNLKQLQINRLLNITQAINNNVSAEGLFNMYKSFLSWEIGVKKMALYVREEEEWACPASIGIPDNLLSLDISPEWAAAQFQRPLAVRARANILRVIERFTPGPGPVAAENVVDAVAAKHPEWDRGLLQRLLEATGADQ